MISDAQDDLSKVEDLDENAGSNEERFGRKIETLIDKTMKKKRMKSEKVKTLACLRKTSGMLIMMKMKIPKFCFEGLMMRTHEELLPFMSMEETWREIVGGLVENDKDIKNFAGCHE